MSSVLTQHDVKRFFDHVETFRKLPILLVYEAGLRLLEVVNLKVSQIDLSRMVFLMKDRQPPIPEHYRADLLRLIQHKKKNDLVFGRGCSTRNLNRQIKEASDASGVRVTSGRLMKAFTVHALERGQSWEDVRSISSYTPGSFRTLLPRKTWEKEQIYEQ